MHPSTQPLCFKWAVSIEYFYYQNIIIKELSFLAWYVVFSGSVMYIVCYKW